MTKTRFERPVLPKDATEEDRRKAMFDALYSLDLSDKLERRENDKLSYLSWANAWAEFKRAYPNAEYRIIKDPTTFLILTTMLLESWFIQRLRRTTKLTRCGCL